MWSLCPATLLSHFVCVICVVHPDSLFLNAMIYRKTAPIWAANPPHEFILHTMEGEEHVYQGHVICWRSDVDKWPQPKQSLVQSYDPTDNTRTIQISELPEPLLFRQWTPKPTSFIAVRDPRPGEASIRLADGNVLHIDSTLDLIARRVDADGVALAGHAEYVIKRSVVAEAYTAVAMNARRE
ncbi:hypothetical protein BC830DRAFT_1143910 [Chytriomyces sp. MP71]|nr:hypothetical protein BC830DRAFT_1143910 [Chytriomyces sp. MP71]